MYVRSMAVSSPPRSDPFGSALRTVRGALVGGVEQPTWSIPESELPDLILSAHAAAAAVQELGCRLVAEADGRNLAEADGASSTTTWVDRLLGCGRFEASQVTLIARRLAGRYELVRQALAAGQISFSKAQVMRVALDRLPAGLSAETLEQAQTSLLEHASVLDPQRLARIGMRMWEVIDPDAVDA